MSKLNILFWVRSSAANKSGLAPLKIRLTLPNKDISDFSTGHTVDIKLWNSLRKQVTGKSSEAARVNLYISRSETKLNDIFDDLEKEGKDISSELVKNIFLGKTQQKLSILTAIATHNEQFKQKVEIEKSLSAKTLGKYEQMQEKLVKFMEEKLHRKDVFVSEINYSFIEDFRTWLLQKGNYFTGGAMNPDSATGVLKKLHKITNHLFKRGELRVDPFIDVKLTWLDPTSEGLTEEQVQAMQDLSFSSQKFQRVLDRFIVGCFSGMAHSDITAATRDNLGTTLSDGQKWLAIKRIKTGTPCKIPILPPVQTIIDKYWNDPQCVKSNSLFPNVHLNTVNEFLKDIAAMAGIKNIKVTSHVARHSFAMLALENGVSIDAIAEILGHSDAKTTRAVYAKASNRFVANEIKHLTDKKFPEMKIVREDKQAG